MMIFEVSELSFEYAALDTARLKFLCNAFRGATAVISGDSGRQELPVEELKEFDHLQGIIDIPQKLKIVKVVEGMGPLMDKNGLMEFMVSLPKGVKVLGETAEAEQAPAAHVGSDDVKRIHEKKVVEIKEMMDKIETATENRTEASHMVEEMLDQGRAGNASSKGVESIVDEIMNNGSSPAMKAIAGLRGSDQTYAHCTDMSTILQGCYADILTRIGKNVSDSINRFTLLSGFMHDIGKSEVPKDILESTVRFAPDSREMLILRNHTTYGARILTDMGMHETTINVSHYHHVKKDGDLFTSYPSAPFESVKPITRLASIVDVYQALIGKRKYKKNWVPGKAVAYIEKLKGTEFDDKMVDNFLNSIGRYPVGSLLRLSTGDLAFVLMIGPTGNPKCPIVAVVENSQGELLPHHTLIDLMLEKDVEVKEVMDHYDHYSDSEDQAYKIFESIHID